MTEQRQSSYSYSEAIDALQAVLAILDEPNKAIGYSYGLQRGQAGYFMAVRARDLLRDLRDELLRYEQEAEAQ